MPNNESANAALAYLLAPTPTLPTGLAGLIGPTPTPQIGLAGLIAAFQAPSPPPIGVNSLCTPISGHAGYGLAGGGLFGRAADIPLVPMPYTPPRTADDGPTRHTFFSFHYADVNRSSIVRRSGQFRKADGSEPAGFYDRSIWEEAKQTDQAALRRLIDRELRNTSVTCVLAGRDTWARPWVRYEIGRSLQRGNALFTVSLAGVQCMNDGPSAGGPDPLDQLGLKWDGQGKAQLWEWAQAVQRWVPYSPIPQAIAWPRWLPNVSSIDLISQLSAGRVSYGYQAGEGAKNLGSWIRAEAKRGGK